MIDTSDLVGIDFVRSDLVHINVHHYFKIVEFTLRMKSLNQTKVLCTKSLIIVIHITLNH